MWLVLFCHSVTPPINVYKTKIFWSLSRRKSIQEAGKCKRELSEKQVHFKAYRSTGFSEMNGFNRPCFDCSKMIWLVRDRANHRWIKQEYESGPIHVCKCTRKQKTKEDIAKENARLLGFG